MYPKSMALGFNNTAFQRLKNRKALIEMSHLNSYNALITLQDRDRFSSVGMGKMYYRSSLVRPGRASIQIGPLFLTKCI